MKSKKHQECLISIDRSRCRKAVS